MKKIIPFQKDISFKENLAEIISISLEHNIQKNNEEFKGDFIVSGEYKMSMNSTHIDTFNFTLPFEIELAEHYDTKDAEVDIDDFYYEIVDNQILSVHIDVLIDKLEEKEELLARKIDSEEENKFIDELEKLAEPEIEKEEEKIEEKVEDVVKEVIEENKIQNIDLKDDRSVEEQNNNQVSSIFDDLIDDNEYKTYKIYIVKEEDTIETIMEKYKITIEEIKKYNEIGELKKGDKIIIPYVKSKQN